MTGIDMQPFCGDSGLIVRDYLSRPMHLGDWTIACNGHIAVRVPRLPDTQETATAPAMIFDMFKDHSAADLGELPLFTPPTGEMDCRSCGGTGEEVDDDYGRAITSTCDTCNGSGKEPILHVTSIEINETILAARYFEMIRALPFPKFSYGFWPGLYSEVSAKQAVHFTFEGGVGLLMPMRSAYPTHFKLSRPGATR
jgi:hypothetical protein